MENIKKLEDKIGEWLKPIPHLPTSTRKWISENVWWATAIGAVISAISIWTLINATFFAASVYNAWSDYAAKFGVDTGVHLNAWNYIMVFGSAIFLAGIVILMVMSVKPLRALKKRGWDLMFLAYLLGIVSQIFSMLNNFTFGSILSVALSAAIGAYFLFEIRSYFIKAGK